MGVNEVVSIVLASGTFLLSPVFSSQSSLMFLGRAAMTKDVAIGAASNCPVHRSPETALYTVSASLVSSALLDLAGHKSARVRQWLV